MKNIYFSCLLVALLLRGNINAQNVGINTTGAAPNASAMLDIVSSNKGLLIPRVSLTSTSDATTITSGNVTSLLVYNSNAGMTGGGVGYWYWNGTAWVQLSTGGGSGWSLTGNAGTTVGANFIGTTDAQPFMIKVNNSKSGYIDYNAAIANTSFGYQTLLNNTSGIYNSAFGYQSLFTNNSGSQNTAIGYQALNKNTSGTLNTAIGYHSLYSNTNSLGSENIAIGVDALYSNTTGSSNSSVGNSSLYSNTIGTSNCAFGNGSLTNNTTGNSNNAIGLFALLNNTSGSQNTSLGVGSLQGNTTGNNNTANGYNAGITNNIGTKNTYLGYLSDGSNALTNSSAIGANAYVKTSNSLILGDTTNVNVGIGTGAPTKKLDIRGTLRIVDGTQGAGKVFTSDASGNGSWQTASGGSGWGLTGNTTTTVGTNFLGTTDAQAFMIKVNNSKSGYIDYNFSPGNTSIGYQTLLNISTGSSNSAFGFKALTNNTSGNYNTAFG